jgi:hypothetical protein
MCAIWAVVVLVLSIGGLLPPAGRSLPAGAGEGCLAVSHGCAYTAHESGAIEGVGWYWHVEIVRGNRRLSFGPGTDLATLRLGVIHPGDNVRAWTDDTDSNPFVYSAVFVGKVDESR